MLLDGLKGGATAHAGCRGLAKSKAPEALSSLQRRGIGFRAKPSPEHIGRHRFGAVLQ